MSKVIKSVEKKEKYQVTNWSAYNKSLVNRFKTIFGSTLYSREFKKQKTEAKIKVKCLSKMTATGMPISKKIAA